MQKLTIAAAALTLALSGAAMAQTTGGSTEGNMNSPGSVKSNSEKGMQSRDMPATTGTATGATKAAPGSTENNMNSPGSVKSDAEKSGR
ncbi:hypothetical protein [Methylobacterium planeticum]|uniref:Pentapeptide MXKDX repeat protein n=1 Tax=Methylobacterium planeticum TaxID=2615211 RepID=A0A6N6MNA3_9HYPH|nr:hypothetical protein [Methylobacterium planeticum]KAB1071639.1 hypothetical protein F6X51_18935 [Methylobacterium planeticum]